MENHESQSPQQCPNPSIPSPAIPNKPTISQRFKTLSLMWDEWHGTGGPDTMDKPIPGGFHQLEECYQNKWLPKIKYLKMFIHFLGCFYLLL